MSSSLTRFLFGVVLALVLLACSVDAHGWMAYPKPRGQYLSPPKPSSVEYAPATIDPNDQAFVCRNDPVMPKASWLPLTAGKQQSITLQFNALHVGDCFVYLTYDGDKPTNEMKWFKIWEQHECKKQNNYEIPIPAYLPSGDHVIFRWEWYALHVYPVVEYYSQCVDATMTGASTGALPQPQVNMPGHLPELVEGDLSKGTNNYWWPWDSQPMKFTGPALATINGPIVPTKAPSASTPAPTQKPTQKPTEKPTTPPTTAPTQRPATTPAPQATQKPSTPSTPAPKPPANSNESVKLVVSPSAGVWWFSVQFTGLSANQIANAQVQDSGCFDAFADMTNEWGDVWYFSAGEKGPLTFPLTIKASLPSGASISFTVNSFSASSSTIDSGALFA